MFFQIEIFAKIDPTIEESKDKALQETSRTSSALWIRVFYFNIKGEGLLLIGNATKEHDF